MRQDRDLQTSTRLSQYAFWTIREGQVRPEEFGSILDVVGRMVNILTEDIPTIDEELNKLGKPISKQRWEAGAMNALESLIPKPHR